MNKQELEEQLAHFKREARANKILLDRARTEKPLERAPAKAKPRPKKARK